MRFDWYSATLADSRMDEVAGMVSRLVDHNPGLVGQQGMPGPFSAIRRTVGLHGYHHGAALDRGKAENLVRFLWGGPNGDDPHAWASGQNASWFAKFCRDEYPGHRVTRVDVAEDFRGKDAFERLTDMALSVADRYGVNVRHVGDWYRCEKGRTLYLGSRRSVTLLRIYEKGLQLGEEDPLWVRVELEAHPKKKARLECAQASPAEMFGLSRWTADLGARLTGMEIERLTPGTVYRRQDDERSRVWMVQQYGPVLERLADELGSWEAVGVWLKDERLRQVNEKKAWEEMAMPDTHKRLH